MPLADPLVVQQDLSRLEEAEPWDMSRGQQSRVHGWESPAESHGDAELEHVRCVTGTDPGEETPWGLLSSATNAAWGAGKWGQALPRGTQRQDERSPGVNARV